ncbi:MAG: DUF4410 domain-containing protein [Pseudomonadota bacterium]|nr:DUF4410 domain-containing protein [Pseudomonadota bacterium]
MKKSIWIIVLFCVVIAFGCHSRTDAPKTSKQEQKEAKKEEKKEQKEDKKVKTEYSPAAVSAGKNLKISVLMDTGDDNIALEKIDQREQLNDWMGRDLVAMLNKAGYEAALIENSGQYKKGTYLLKVTIVKYSAGSKAARIIVGYGAGAVSLDTKYELFAPDGNRILSDAHGVGSGRDWTYCARKLNKQTVDAVSDKIRR